MKILQKLSIIALIAIIAILTLGVVANNTTFAAGDNPALSAMKNVTGNDSDIDAGDFATVASRVLTFLQIASGIMAIIMIAVTGFRYIVETPDMKSELKKSMIPIIVGILLVFFATSIAKFFINVFGASHK